MSGFAGLLRGGEEGGAGFFEEDFGGFDAVVFGEGFAFVFDADVAVVFVLEHDAEHFCEVGFGFFAVVPEVVGLGGDSFGVGHEFFHAFVAVVAVEVSEVGEGAAVVEADVFEDLGHPGSVGGEAAVVFDDDVDLVVFGEGSESAEAFDAVGGFFVVVCSFAVGVDADGVAAEVFGGGDPFLVVVDRLLAAFIGSGAEGAFAIDHDEDVVHAEVGDAFFEFAEVFHVLGFVFKELVDVFESEDVVGFFGVFRPVHVDHLTAFEGLVVGPLGEGDVEEVFGLGGMLAVVIGEGSGGEGGEG